MEHQTLSDKRITDLEIKLSHIEQQLEDMNGALLSQNDLIVKLERKLARAEGKIAEIGEDHDTGLSATEIAARDKPPHY